MASISLDLSGGSGSVECQANFNFQVSLVYFPIQRQKKGGGGDAVAQSVERATPGEVVSGSIPAVAARSLLSNLYSI